MNILIVDDEAYSVAGIAASLDWKSLGIDEVYKAYSMSQAQVVFRECPIDIMICDIEMPQGSGIELMQWVREQSYETVCIFLTCYFKFDYTSRAFKLDIFDYILKPAEYSTLADAVQRAVNKVEENSALRLQQQRAEFWTQERDHILAEFWTQLLTESISTARLKHHLSTRHLSEKLADGTYYLALFQILQNRDNEAWSKDLMDYAFSNVVFELLSAQAIPQIEPRRFLAVVDAAMHPDITHFEEQCKKAAVSLREILPAEFLVYYDVPHPMAECVAAYHALLDDAHRNLSVHSMVFRHGSSAAPEVLAESPQERWQNALLAHASDIILEDIEHILYPQGEIKIIDRTVLHTLYHSLLSAVYFVLDLHHLPVHQPLSEEDVHLAERALDSIPDFQLWATEITESTVKLIQADAASSSLVETVRRYVRENLNGDLSRTALANHVHLHPDYLSTLFREKSGSSLTEFITRERIRCAKSLLLTTALPISEIAIRTGFQNISYFSKQFRRLEKQTPMQYRNNPTAPDDRH